MPEKNKPTRIKSEHEINSATTESETRKTVNEHKEIYTTYFGHNPQHAKQANGVAKKAKFNSEREH